MNNNFIWIIIIFMFIIIGLFGCSNDDSNKIILNKSDVYCKILTTDTVAYRNVITTRQRKLCSFTIDSSETVERVDYDRKEQLKKLVESQ